MENIKGEVVDQVMRKGPWTEQEDVQLVLYVNLFGDRRWDFIAKVSGLKRTGKSCRLRWVNYLHPGLKRGKMTPHEQRRVLELYSKWGNRWSKIARKIPGRTDNEIKNYWRTHMRKKAQDQKKKSMSQSSSSSSSSSDFAPPMETKGRSFYDTGGNGMMDFIATPGEKISTTASVEENNNVTKVYSMDEIWKDIELSEESSNNFNMNTSPAWDFFPAADSVLWSAMDEQESKMMMTDNYNSFPFQNHMTG